MVTMQAARPRGWAPEIRAAVLARYRPGECGYDKAGEPWAVPSSTVKRWVQLAGLAPVAVPNAAGELVRAGEDTQSRDGGGLSDPLPVLPVSALDPLDYSRMNVSPGRIRRLVDGWVRLTEESQATAAVGLQRLRELVAESSDPKAVAAAVAAATQTGERGHNAWLDIVRPDRKATTVDARSLTVQQVWANVERRRDRGAAALLTELGESLTAGETAPGGGVVKEGGG